MDKEFKLFNHPKNGLFSVEKVNGKYHLGTGWEKDIKEYLIIGECSVLYYYKDYNQTGSVNKTRLIRWNDTQLKLNLN